MLADAEDENENGGGGGKSFGGALMGRSSSCTGMRGGVGRSDVSGRSDGPAADGGRSEHSMSGPTAHAPTSAWCTHSEISWDAPPDPSRVT